MVSTNTLSVQIQVISLFGFVAFLGIVGWNAALTANQQSSSSGGGGTTFLAPQITGLHFDGDHNVQIKLTGSISSDPNVYQYVSIMRGLSIFLSDETSDPENLPLFSLTRISVTFSNLTLLAGDVIIHRFYDNANVMTGSMVASVTKTYHRVCVLEIRNLTIPYCWDMNSQNYCTTPQIGIHGQILTNVSAYFAANVSASLKLDERSGCYFVLLNSAIDRTLFRSMHSDVITTQAGQGNCMKFNMDPTSNDNTDSFILPAFTCVDASVCFSFVFDSVGRGNVFIGYTINDTAIVEDDLVVFDSSANAPPYEHFFQSSYQLRSVNITICGFLNSWSFRQIPFFISENQIRFTPRVLTGGITNLYQWGDLGLEHLDFNYGSTVYTFSTQFTTVSATDTPNMDTLTSLAGLQYNYNSNNDGVTNFIPLLGNWNVSNVVVFDYMFYFTTLGSISMHGISNWTLNKLIPVSMNSIFYGMTASYTNVSVANWNPLAGKLDYAFANQGVVIPDIRTWTLLPNVCANYMLNQCTTLTSSLYADLLVKFSNETVSTGCIWRNIVPTTNTTPAFTAIQNLCCNRGWDIRDSGGNRCTGIC